jgi:threonine dehydrogenase-like Zn-dependent dehydrogenase
MLRARGMEVVTIGRRPAPHRGSEIVEASGARYVAADDAQLQAIATDLPPLDLMLEASGRPEPAVAAMEMLGNNGVLVLLSGPGAGKEMTVPISSIYGSLLRGNKVVVGSVNSNKEDFELAVADLARFETLWPGLAARLITRRLDGLDQYAHILEHPEGDVKTIIEV